MTNLHPNIVCHLGAYFQKLSLCHCSHSYSHCGYSYCYSFGYGMVWTICLFTVHVSGLIDSFGTESNIFDPCPFLSCLYLVFPFLSRQSSLESPLVSSVLVFPFCGHFQRLLIHTYVG